MSMRVVLFCVLSAICLAACQGRDEPAPADDAPEFADLLLLNGYVYTVDPQRSTAGAVAVRDGLIVAVGSDGELEPLRGPETEVIDLAGRMLLPGLQDAHLHIFGIVEPDVCTLRSRPMALVEMVPYLQECMERYAPAPGEWMTVDMWNFAVGNQVSDEYPNMRVALDAVSTEHPIILWGNDGHHGAVNSRALERARDALGNSVGLSAETLATAFADYRELIGVDESGEPDGGLHEHARSLVGPPPRRDPAKLGHLLPQIGEVLASNGITSAQDAALDPGFLPYLREFEASGDMRFRLRVATRLVPADYRDPLTGEVAIDTMLEELESIRRSWAGNPLVRPAAVKIYADGVLEGNVYADPPALPNSAVLTAYRQPRFRFDPLAGSVDVTGYIDTASPLCQETRANMDAYRDERAREAFRAEHGFHPLQCTISFGVMRDPEQFIDAYVRRLDDAGFTIHIHAIGDRAVRAAADALEQVVPPDGSNPLRHGMAHLQLVHPEDQQRIGRMGLYIAWTFAWMLTDWEYDWTVIPFIDDVTDPGGIYDPAHYSMQNVYPARSMAAYGAVTVAGSDAPVDDRSPRPFVNIALGATRRGRDGSVLNDSETLDIHELIAAYTINAARALDHEASTGSIEPGKKADLAVLDRNIVLLWEQGKAAEISETRVDLTLFGGEVIYRRH